MLGLIQNEILKITGKWRSAIGFMVIGGLMPLVIWGFSVGGERVHRDMVMGLEDSFYVVGSIFNGFLATYLVMNLLWVHIPFLIMISAGDAVAGEGASGTLRIYLTRSVSRGKILWSKLIATYLYTTAIILFFAIMSLGLGSIWLGTGDLIVFQDGILILPPEEAWLRFGLAFMLAIAGMCVISTICFMFSTMVNNGIGPIIGGMAVLLIGMAITTLPIEVFEKIKPFLFTSYLDSWLLAFHDPVPWKEITYKVVVLMINAGLFIVISFWVFLKKDIRT